MVLGIIFLAVIIVGLAIFLIIRKNKKEQPVVVPPWPNKKKDRYYGDQYYENK